MINKYFSIFSFTLFSFLFSQDVVLSLDGSDLNYESSANIAGFQFNHDGCATNANGGDAAINSFSITTSTSAVIAFSLSGSIIPIGSGILINLGSNECAESSLFNFVFSDSNGGSLISGWGN